MKVGVTAEAQFVPQAGLNQVSLSTNSKNRGTPKTFHAGGGAFSPFDSCVRQ